MKRFPLFLAGFFMGAIRYSLLLILAVILVIVGLFWSSICIYVGLGILGLFLVLCLLSTRRMSRMLNQFPMDADQLNAMMEQLRQSMGGDNPLLQNDLIRDEDLAAYEEAEESDT